MEAKDLFKNAVAEAAGCISKVKTEHLGNATPCTEWDLRELLNHIVYELRWVPDLLAGKTAEEVGTAHDGDVLGSDPVGAWQRASEAAISAAQNTDDNATVHLSAGDKSAKDYIAEMGMEILVHGWDVSQSLNCSLVFEPAVAQAAYEVSVPNQASWQANGLIADPVAVPEDASYQHKLLGLMGRKVEA